MTKQIQLSLSRSHKIVERITREINSVNALIIKDSKAISINVESERHKVVSNQDKVSKNIELRNSLYAALESVRIAVAEKNSACGVHTLLAKKAILLKKLQDSENYLRHLAVDPGQRDGVTADEVTQYLVRLEKAETVKPVFVKVLDQDAISAIEKEVKQYTSELDALSDSINDLNAVNKVSFVIDEEIASSIGL